MGNTAGRVRFEYVADEVSRGDELTGMYVRPLRGSTNGTAASGPGRVQVVVGLRVTIIITSQSAKSGYTLPSSLQLWVRRYRPADWMVLSLGRGLRHDAVETRASQTTA